MQAIPPRRGAFTLIEILVVVVILMIVVTLVVSVGSYIRTRAQEKKVHALETVIMTAVQAYYDKTHPFPAEPYPNGAPQPPKYTAAADPSSGSAELGALAKSELLYIQLMAVKDSRDKLSALASDVIATDSTSGTPAVGEYPRTGERYFRDPNGITFDYRTTGGVGGGPVIISAGADKLHGNNNAYEDDNIRSDRQ